jgi:hypothetical protein
VTELTGVQASECVTDACVPLAPRQNGNERKVCPVPPSLGGTLEQGTDGSAEQEGVWLEAGAMALLPNESVSSASLTRAVSSESRPAMADTTTTR